MVFKDNFEKLNTSLFLIVFIIIFLIIFYIDPVKDERYSTMITPFILTFGSFIICKFKNRKKIFYILVLISILMVSTTSPFFIINKKLEIAVPEFSVLRIINFYNEETENENLLKSINDTFCVRLEISGFGHKEKISFLTKQKPKIGVQSSCVFYLSHLPNETFTLVNSSDYYYLYRLK